MRINVDHLVPIGIVIGLFILAILCLACTMNPREIIDCSIFRCCCRRGRCRRRRRGRGIGNVADGGDDGDEEDPRTYETLNEFIFEAENEERAGFVEFNDIPTETSVQNVFPDLLGGGGGSGTAPWASTSAGGGGEGDPSGGVNNSDKRENTANNSVSGNDQLNEPLL